MGSSEIRSAGVATMKTKRAGRDFEPFRTDVDHREGVRKARLIGDSGVLCECGLWSEQLRILKTARYISLTRAASGFTGYADTHRHRLEIIPYARAQLICYSSLKSRRWYSNALPRLFPIAMYWLLAEKSTLSTRPSGVPEVGQFE